VLVCVLSLILAGVLLHVWDSYQVEHFESFADLSQEELDAMRQCAPEAVAEWEREAFGVDKMCTTRNERKHPITLLSSMGSRESNYVRYLFEASSGVATYSPYASTDNKHTLACSFQTGPWELYCRGSPDCMMQHPPPWHVPYLVKTLHPSLETVCGDFGYPLPTHDAIVHIVRNPIDAIGAATGDYVSPAIAMFEKWHSYWKTYESTTFPNIPAVWIRYEDVCYCQAQVLQKLLEIGHVYGVPQERIDRVLDSFTCDLIGDSEDQLGYFLDKFSLEDMDLLATTSAIYAGKFGYRDLFLEMTRQVVSGKKDTHKMFRALYPKLSSSKKPEYCEAAVKAFATPWTDVTL